MQKLRINMEQNTSSKLDTSTEPTSNTPLVASRPTESELDLELADLVHWQRFAIHLPYITAADIEEIKLNNSPISCKSSKMQLAVIARDVTTGCCGCQQKYIDFYGNRVATKIKSLIACIYTVLF